jgi:hypothetical protein
MRIRIEGILRLASFGLAGLGLTSLGAVGGLISVACVAQVEQTRQQYRSPAADGGVREVLESIVVPPLSGAPFTATLDTEWVKYAADGVTITLANERHIARDGRGRIYEERWFLVPKNGNVKSEMNWIQLADPKLRTQYNCGTQRHICELRTYDPGDDLSAAAPLKPLPPRAMSADNVSVEDLGTRNLVGIDTIGRRETITVEAGTIGNDQPFTTLKEYWHSQELGLNLLSIRSGPMVGKQTFTITELTAAEPDPQLFELPAGYKVTDLRKNPPISW